MDNLFRYALPRVASKDRTRSGLSSRPQCCCRPTWSARPLAQIVSISGNLVECAMDGQQDVADGDKTVASPGRADNEWMGQHMTGDNDLR